MHRLEVARTLRRDLQPRVQSSKERHPEVRFQRLDLSAQGRRRQVELRRGFLEAQGFRRAREGEEERNRRQLFAHHPPLTSWRRPSTGRAGQIGETSGLSRARVTECPKSDVPRLTSGGTPASMAARAGGTAGGYVPVARASL